MNAFFNRRYAAVVVWLVLAPFCLGVRSQARDGVQMALPPPPPTPEERATRDFRSTDALPKGVGVPVVDTTNKVAVTALFQNVYLTALGKNSLIGWTGDVGDCRPGTVTEEHLDATLEMVNYFRVMTGLPGNVVFDPALNALCQQAALMMAAEGNLSHSPPTDWACYTEEGAEAAGNSNLALGAFGPKAVASGYMNDSDPSNIDAGHRRWILYPRQVTMGTGSTDARSGGGFFVGSNALWTLAA